MGTEAPSGSEGKGTPILEAKGLLLKAVSVEEAGVGLPYAPENWPNPGDNWGWRVGKRVSVSGNFVDRYLYLPKRLSTSEAFSSRKGAFASKLSVSRYLEEKFPGTDISAFFASFIWKIPSKRGPSANGHAKRGNIFCLPTNEQIEQFLSESVPGGCKAGNKSCVTVTDQSDDSTTTTTTASIDCDLCCSEPRFCRDCSCILCCKSVDYGLGGYTFVKCEAEVAGECGRICAHLCHLSCALRSYMAGKVGGTIGLDAEYFCRRCDAKTDLVPKVAEMMRTCEALDSLDNVEKVLKLGAAVLRGSERSKAKGLLSRVESVISKINSGTCLEDIWKVEEDLNLSTDITNHGIAAMEIVADQDPMDIHSDSLDMSARVDWLTESLNLEEEIDHALLGLRKSQEIEYKLAEDKLYDQKNYITSLYQQLEIERSDLSRHTSSADQENLLSIVMNTMDQIKQELAKLKDMEKVARGFGKTSKVVLEELFGLDIEG